MMPVICKYGQVCSKGANSRICMIALLVFLVGMTAGKHAAYAYPSNNVPSITGPTRAWINSRASA